MRFYRAEEVSPQQRRAILRPESDRPTLEQVTEIFSLIEEIRLHGDDALLEVVRKFDSPNIAQLEVHDWKDARCRPDLQAALELAAERIRAFHQTNASTVEPAPGSILQTARPIDRAGIYAPGGKALYPSSVLMTAIPAKAAGVQEVVLCTPAQPDGRPADVVLAAAVIAGVDRVFSIGGPAAIAAMAYGTASVPRVDAIAGPGSQRVNLAKRLVWGDVGVDLFAGASESAIIADGSVDSAWVAADLLTQLEHGEDSRCLLVCTDEDALKAILQEAKAQIEAAPRETILQKAFENSPCVLVNSLDEAVLWANEFAPEHLSLLIEYPDKAQPYIKNAGCILVGAWTAQAMGDYVAGPSHCLPTGGAARFASPLGVDFFLKRTSIVWLTKDQATDCIQPIVELAIEEGLPQHAKAAEIRLQ